MNAYCVIILFRIGEEKRLREGKQIAQGHRAGIWGQLSTPTCALSPMTKRTIQFAQDLQFSLFMVKLGHPGSPVNMPFVSCPGPPCSFWKPGQGKEQLYHIGHHLWGLCSPLGICSGLYAGSLLPGHRKMGSVLSNSCQHFNTGCCFYLWPTLAGLSGFSLNINSSERLSLTQLARSLQDLLPQHLALLCASSQLVVIMCLLLSEDVLRICVVSSVPRMGSGTKQVLNRNFFK